MGRKFNKKYKKIVWYILVFITVICSKTWCLYAEKKEKGWTVQYDGSEKEQGREYYKFYYPTKRSYEFVGEVIYQECENGRLIRVDQDILDCYTKWKEIFLNKKILDGKEYQKNYDETEYVNPPRYGRYSTYFLEEDGMGYELLISCASEDFDYKRQVKVLVSEKQADTFNLRQILDVPNHEGAAWDNKGIHLVDVDFDGKKDILVQTGHYGAQGANHYVCFLYRESGYEKCDSFSEIPNASIDAENKVILGYWRNSASSHSNAIYQYKDSEFIPWKLLTYEEIENKDYNRMWKYTEEEKGKVIKEILERNGEKSKEAEVYFNEEGMWNIGDYNRWNSLYPR